MAMALCPACGEWISELDHQCKSIPFNVIMTDEDKKQNKKDLQSRS